MWADRSEEAEEKYKDIARSLGWTPGVEQEMPVHDTRELTVEELLLQEYNESSNEGDGGMANSVSIMAQPDEDINEEPTVHSYVVSGDLSGLQDLISTNPSVDLNALDQFVSFTELSILHFSSITSCVYAGVFPSSSLMRPWLRIHCKVPA